MHCSRSTGLRLASSFYASRGPPRRRRLPAPPFHVRHGPLATPPLPYLVFAISAIRRRRRQPLYGRLARERLPVLLNDPFISDEIAEKARRVTRRSALNMIFITVIGECSVGLIRCYTRYRLHVWKLIPARCRKLSRLLLANVSRSIFTAARSESFSLGIGLLRSLWTGFSECTVESLVLYDSANSIALEGPAQNIEICK